MKDTFVSLYRWFLVILFTIFWISLSIIFWFFSKKLSNLVFKNWAALCLRIFKIKVIVHDKNQNSYPDPPYLVAFLNQTSLSEAFLFPFIAPFPFFVLANYEFVAIPFLGWRTWLADGVIVYRNWSWQAMKAIKKSEKKMKINKKNLYISVEGQRSQDGKLQPYKKGAAVSAILSQANIVPLYIEGCRRIWAYGTWKVRPGTVQVFFDSVISTKGLEYKDRNELTAKLREIGNTYDHTYSQPISSPD